MRTSRWLWVAALLSLILSLTPSTALLLYPFKLFTTWAHECSHALMAVLVGGSVRAITIEADGSGLTESLVPVGRLSQGLVSSAGYLGASIVGCLLLAASRIEKRAHAILWILGGLMLVTLAIWVRNPFGFAVVLAWALGLVMLARQGAGETSRFVLSLLAIQVALNAVYDIRILFLVPGARTDAGTMERLFVLPAWVWASAWMAASIAMVAWTIWITRGGRRSRS